MPTAFPERQFQAFKRGANAFFPTPTIDEDPLETCRHFMMAWLAVRYRYRICAECNDEFKALLANASQLWRAWSADEEQNYELERCIYLFFMSGLSVFESFGFCLYFVGNALRPADFPHVGKPKSITLAATAKAFAAAFPQAKITGLLAGLQGDAGFTTIDDIRNILAHRLSGRRSIQYPDGMYTHTREETWYLPGAAGKLMFGEEFLQRHLDDIIRLLTALASAAREFVKKHHQPGQPLS
jgi:hypothetical protein